MTSQPKDSELEDEDFLDVQDELIKATNAKLQDNKLASKAITSTPNRDGEENALDEEPLHNAISKTKRPINYDANGSTYASEQSSKRHYQSIKKAEAKMSSIGKFIFSAIMCLGALLGFMLITEFVAFWSNIQSMPELLQWCLLGVLGLFALIILWVMAKLFTSMLRFKQAGGLELGTVKSLAGIDQFKAHAQRDFALFQKDMVARLKKLQPSSLAPYGAKEEELAQIATAKDYLLGSCLNGMSPENWIERYVSDMETPIQGIAQRRILTYSKKVGASTAISPFPIIDQLIVLSSMLALTQDLFSIYQLKLNKLDNLKLIGLSISNTYFASVAQEYSVEATDGIVDSMLDPEYLSQMGVGAVIGKTISAKAGEGIVNGFLIWRIGKYINKRLTL